MDYYNQPTPVRVYEGQIFLKLFLLLYTDHIEQQIFTIKIFIRI